ncbi:MAG TPA: ABC transporter permease [Gemmatimonadaceae bacterium]|jgi:putative ABC transport system permease protein|nr:ABC transporter permease [Gemmatimonadaceae bacterium]
MPDRIEQAREIATHVAFSARTAAEAVGHNKLRAGLTSLGILFGVASVIAMLAIGNGAEQEILEQMRLLGANNIIVTPIVEQKEGKVDKDDKKESKRFTPGLTYQDAASIADVIPDVGATSSEVVTNTVITREGRHRSGKIVGVDSTYFRLMNLRLAQGAYFARPHFDAASPVAIIGQGVKSRFFTTEEPLGRAVKVGNQWLTVVGVLEDRKVSAETAQRLGIRDANMDVYVPLPTMLLRYRNRAEVTQQEMELAARGDRGEADSSETDDQRAEKRNYHQLDKIVVQVDRSVVVPQVADVMRRLLARRHNDVVDFEITVPELLLKQEQRTKTIFNVVLGAIASISLVVGGIGIMNIMLASILERIKEIGVRRAVGATQKDVLAQFLSEAVMISLAGGLAGIVTGAILSSIIEHAAKIHTIVSPLSVVVAFGVSVAVGLLFGIVPAWRAARQDPVVCLRYE